ncbi:MAG: hypothetical protein Q8Q04_03160, partial [archaeon]|nr:hypothetical protein [archaeon]
MVEKIAIIENKEQAKEFLRRKKEFEDFLPITFSYEAEEFFLDNNVKFKMEEDYETEGIYEGLYNSSLNTTNELCKEIKFYYREIELFELFYQDLLIFVGNNQKYLKILEKINKIEKPDKVVIFQEERKNPNKEICSKLAKEFFKKKGKKITYSCKKKKKLNNFINFAGIIQKKISKIILSFSMKKNFIFFIDGKQRSEFLLKELLKNKEKLFRCHNRLQKGFFVGKEYIPFYQFSGKESIHQKELLIRISKMLEREKFYFLKKIFFDKIILLRLKEWIAYYIQYKFIEISFIINDLINFMGNKKINAIIVYADTP